MKPVSELIQMARAVKAAQRARVSAVWARPLDRERLRLTIDVLRAAETALWTEEKLRPNLVHLIQGLLFHTMLPEDEGNPATPAAVSGSAAAESVLSRIESGLDVTFSDLVPLLQLLDFSDGYHFAHELMTAYCNVKQGRP